MNVLAEFLLARITEDEAAAIQCRAYDIESAAEDMAPRSVIVEPIFARYVDHFDPRRFLAECDAKRHIVDAYKAAVMDESLWRRRPESVAYQQAVARVSAWTYALTELARTYADHPDYREGWKPE